MNDDELDNRLRTALPDETLSGRDKTLTNAKPSRSRRISDAWHISTASTRRSVVGGIGAVAVAALVVPMTLPAQSSLFEMAAGGTSAETAKMSSTAMDSMAMWIEYNYIPGDNLSTEIGRGTVYKFELSGDPLEHVTHIAEVIGVDGDAHETSYSDDTYPTFIVGSEEGTSESIVLSWSGTGAWWYNNPAAYPELRCIEPLSSDEKSTDDYVEECAEYEPAPTGDNPSKDDAVAEALAVFGELGASFTAQDLTVTRDEWGTYVTGYQSVDGQLVALEWSIAWSGNGEISWIAGSTAHATPVGDFDTVSAVAAVSRLSDWRWFGSAPAASMPWVGALSSVAKDAATAEGDVAEGFEGEGEGVPAEEATATPTPVESETATPEPVPAETTEPMIEPAAEPTPTIMDMIIDTAVPQLLMVWDTTGAAWLVPGFIMTGDEGWPMAVVSLIEGVITLPDLEAVAY